MSRKRKKDRLYFREGRGWYADLRDKSGRLEAMIPPGSRRATQDRDEASKILAARLKELESPQHAGAQAASPGGRVFGDYARYHLERKARTARASTVARDEQSLRVFRDWLCARYGRDRKLNEITVEIVEEFDGYRMDQGMAVQTRLNDLHALSNLFRGAMARSHVTTNPARDLPGKPKPIRREAVWLEPGEAAALLESAGRVDESPGPRKVRFLRPLLATFLLTGGRSREVRGLEVGDIDFDRGHVHFRPNEWRLLKTDTSDRRVPLWPQLEDILNTYVQEHDLASGLLFPSPCGGMLGDIRGSLRRALDDAGITKRITNHSFRHTYASQRVQTVTETRTPRGDVIWAAVDLLTIARELGHEDVNMLTKVYGHLQQEPERSTVVEYREAVVVPFPKRAVC